MPGQQPAEAPALGKWEWPPRTHHTPVWFGSKPGPMWPRPHRMDRGQNGKSTCRNSKQSSCSLLSAQHVAGWAESFTWDYNSGPPTGSVPSQVIRSHIRTGPQVRLIPELMATCKVHKAHSCPLGAQSSGETDPKQRWTMGLLSPEEEQVISPVAGGSRGPDVICPLCFHPEVMGCEHRGARNVPVWFIIDLAPNTGLREYC